MGTQARVVVLPPGTQELRVEDLELPEPGPTQVVIKQFASGVCHSQLHQMHRERTAPTVLGHESTGVVLQTGSDVSHVQEGDTVLVTWVPRDAASADTPPAPLEIPVIGSLARAQGVFTWADHTICDGQYVVKVDASTPHDVTAIIGCAVMTGAGAVVNSAGVQPGESAGAASARGVELLDEEQEQDAKPGTIILIWSHILSGLSK